ncbi:uncharacterized protein LOC132186239 isoform X3 [Corylus avellana]|uniref:uncharacterized protein LOC132186239 isoform X3 n=1 Tax=Corylus avellana TaxID=13451 RepID=UPI00286BA393|nr:uncharacterized protein LOC132186239 isoform X3 [Corylus avellana]
MKNKGHKPTGQLVQTARNAGYSSVLEMLNVKGPDNLCQEEVVEIMGETPKKAVASNKGPEVASPRKTGKENFFGGKTDADLNSQKLETNCSEKKSKKTKQEGDCSHLWWPSQLTLYKLKCDKEPLNSRLGPPDFHPQTPNCHEETLTRDYVQSGYRETIKGIEETSEISLTQVQASTKPFIIKCKEKTS